MFHKGGYDRFINVFTKLRSLQLPDLDFVLLLDNDLMVRQTSCDALDTLFSLRPPAAMLRAQRGHREFEHGTTMFALQGSGFRYLSCNELPSLFRSTLMV